MCSHCSAGGMAHWPAMERWRRPSYLHAVAGPRTVPVEVGRHYLADGWGQRLMPLSDFIDRHVLQRPAGEIRGNTFLSSLVQPWSTLACNVASAQFTRQSLPSSTGSGAKYVFS